MSADIKFVLICVERWGDCFQVTVIVLPTNNFENYSFLGNSPASEF